MATSRPFAYNTGASIPGTQQIGNLAVGTPSAGFESTGLKWWNGPDEDLGYVIAHQNPTGQPGADGTTANLGFWRSSDLTDASFISLVEAISDQDFATATDAKNWVDSNNYWTSFSGNPASLLVYLDSGNASSYPGSGSIWSDLTTNDNDATLINTPTYSALDGGILRFDKISLEYATIPNIGDLNQWTVETWFRLDAVPVTGFPNATAVVTNQYDLGSKLNFSIGTNLAPSTYNICAGFYDGTWRTTTGFAPLANTWYQVTGTYDGTTLIQYVNGSASGGMLTYTGTPQSGGEIRLMRRWDGTVSSGQLVDGDLAIVKIYNAALTSGEISASFEANRSRFGL